MLTLKVRNTGYVLDDRVYLEKSPNKGAGAGRVVGEMV